MAELKVTHAVRYGLSAKKHSLLLVLLGVLAAQFLILAGSNATAGPITTRLEFGVTSDRSTASSLDAALGYQNRNTRSGSARLMWSGNAGAMQIEIHSHLAFTQGDNVGYATAIAPFSTSVPATLFDLTTPVYSNSATSITNTIDRLYVGYSATNFVVRVGRQAITWGSGMVFHPADIIAPFAPNAVDTSFKTGADMIYTQVLFDSGADLQFVVVPRSSTLNGTPLFDSSTFALMGTGNLGSLDVKGLLAKDRGDAVASLGLGGALGGAAWNAEVVGWSLGGSSQLATSFVANISHSSVIFGRNITYLAEYFHNGFGVSSSVALDALPTSLSNRLATGQLFSMGQDYLALGGQIVLTPDVVLAPNAVISLNDYSSLVGMQVNWTLGDNTNLVLNYFQPFGANGSEFGGRETSAGSGIYVRSPQEVSLKLVQFF